MSFLKEFREFALRGNVVDMAVGIIIGAAFGKIVSSLVDDVVMPPIGYLIGGVDFTDLSIVLREAQEGAAAVTIGYGKFLQVSFNFLIVAFAIFMLIKGLNSLRRKEEQKPEKAKVLSSEAMLLTEIRDLLKRDQ